VNKISVKNIVEWFLHIAVAVVLGLGITTYIGRLTIVDGNSMSPTLKNQNVIIIECLTPRFGNIKQGDIVVLKIPELLEGKKKYAIKRVIATENQHVEIRDGKVFVDGSELSESYTNTHVEIRDGKVFVDGSELSESYTNTSETYAAGSPYDDIIVPEDCIYLLGDNRIPDKSRDSRTFGVVSKKRIVGKSWIRIFPFSQAGPIK
jgi:signal peptidase I